MLFCYFWHLLKGITYMLVHISTIPKLKLYMCFQNADS